MVISSSRRGSCGPKRATFLRFGSTVRTVPRGYRIRKQRSGLRGGNPDERKESMTRIPKTRIPEEVAAALANPFDLTEVHSKPAAVNGNQPLPIAFVAARTIQH